MAWSIPLNAFAIVYDRERNIVVDCGFYDECRERARNLNIAYQSTAYSAREVNLNG